MIKRRFNMGRSRRLRAALVLVGGSMTVPAVGQTLDHLEIEADECPSAALLRSQLEPVLSPSSGEPWGGPPLRIQVRDLGLRYRIDVGGKSRSVQDTARDCLERARVSAVFVALNLDGVASGPAREPVRARWRWGVQASLLGEAAPSTSASTSTSTSASSAASAAGVGAGVLLHDDSGGIGAGVAALSPSTVIRSTTVGDTEAEVEIVRVPLSITLARWWSLGAMALGPAAGFTAEWIFLRGKGFAEDHAGARLNPGATLGIEANWPLSRQWSFFAATRMRAFPRRYRLVVEPVGAVGYTPRLWFGLELGVRAEPFD